MTTQTAAARVRELRDDLHRIRAEKPGSGRALDAYVTYMREASLLGLNPTALRENSEDEVERFFARTVPGPDGHVYWDGNRNRGFIRNDGTQRLPGRWWWEHAKGTLGVGDAVYPSCGDAACINPEHAERQDRGARHRLYTDSQIIGALQVWSLRHRATPTSNEWRRAKILPTAFIIRHRFGGWHKACQAAGLVPHERGNPARSTEECLASLRAAKEILGRWPRPIDYKTNATLRAELQARGLPVSPGPMYAHLGGPWDSIIERAKGT